MLFSWSGCGVSSRVERYADPVDDGTPVPEMITGGHLMEHRSMNGSPTIDPAPLVPEKQTIASMFDVTKKRQKIIEYLWGSGGFPSAKLPTLVKKNVVSPVDGLVNLERVDDLSLEMDAGVESMAHHFIPAQSKTNRLVVLHHGHENSFNDDARMRDTGYGMQRTIRNLLQEGYSVLAVYMPGCLPGAPMVPHATIVQTPTTGSGLKFFLEPVAVYLNYLQSQADADAFPHYQDFSMMGLSGGGWTTTVYAALDPRISLSIPVAGTLPLALRSGWSIGDAEQTDAAFYGMFGYVDLYILGAVGQVGQTRRQVQVLNRHDDCCFGESAVEYNPAKVGMAYDDAVRSYEREVRGKLQALSNGSFSLEIDEVATEHMLSWNTLASVVLRELHQSAGAAGGGSAVSVTPPFYRGPAGTLLHAPAPDAVEDTGVLMVGQPAVVEQGGGRYDLFFRDPRSRLVHAVNGGPQGKTWTLESLDVVVVTDPVVLAADGTRFDLAALTRDYVPRHWQGDRDDVSLSWTVTGLESFKGFGSPRLTMGADSRVELSVQDWHRVMHDFRDLGDGTWFDLTEPPPTLVVPTTAAPSDTAAAPSDTASP